MSATPKSGHRSALLWCPLCAKSKPEQSQQSNCLFDHLVSGGEQRSWNGQPKCLGGLEVDYQFELGRCLNGKVGRLLAAQNTIDVGCRASPCSDRVEAVGEQTALGCENSGEIDCRQAMPRRQYDDRSTICRCFGMW